MTTIWSDTGNASVGTLKTFTFQTFLREDALTPSILPTTEPTTSQIIYTIQDTDLPIITPNPVSTKYSAFILCSGKNTSGATANVSYRVIKNGNSVVTGQTSATNNNFWSQSHWRLYDVQVGDVVEIRLWATLSSVNLDYSMLQIFPTQVVLSPIGTLAMDLVYGGQDSTSTPTPTGAGVRGTTLNNTQSFATTLSSQGTIGNSNGVMYISANGGTVHLAKSTSFGWFRVCLDNGLGGTSGGTTGYNHLTNTAYQRQSVPSTITFRELRL